jgi:hypothetical protein
MSLYCTYLHGEYTVHYNQSQFLLQARYKILFHFFPLCNSKQTLFFYVDFFPAMTINFIRCCTNICKVCRRDNKEQFVKDYEIVVYQRCLQPRFAKRTNKQIAECNTLKQAM